MGPRAFVATVATAMLCSSAAAYAGESPSPSKEAQAIFTEARKLDEAGDLENACRLYRDALNLEPAAVGGRLHLARCLERSDKLASALEEYAAAEDAATASKQLGRAAHAKARKEELAAKVGAVVVDVAADAMALARFEIRLDGAPLPSDKWGVAVSLDAGKHAVDASALDRLPFSQSFVISNGAKSTVSVPSLEPRSRGAVWPFLVGGVGLAMGAAAVGFAADQATTQATVNDRCDEVACDTSGGFDPAAANARLDRDFGLALGLGLGGGLAVGAGIVGLIVSSRGGEDEGRVGASSLRPWVGLNRVGFELELGFQ